LEVVSFTLINSATDQSIRLLRTTDTINLAVTPDITVRANLCVEPVGSVKFFLNGSLYKTENTAPYSLTGDNSGDYIKWNVTPGSYTLLATPYSGINGSGTVGTSKTINLLVINKPPCTSSTQCNDNNACTTDACSNNLCANTPIAGCCTTATQCNDNNACTTDACSNNQCANTPIANCCTTATQCNDNNACTADACSSGVCTFTLMQRVVTSFTLVNAATDLDIGPLNNGAVINAQTPEVNVRANLCTNTGTASVKFNLNGSQYKIEASAPWALAGDVSGNYNKWNVTPGTYTIQAIPYSAANATGTVGTSLSVTISVISGGAKMSDVGTHDHMTDDKTSVTAHPNPFTNHLNFEFSVAKDSEISLELFNITGVRIATIYNGMAERGIRYEKIFYPGMIPNGVYVYRLTTNETVITERVILAK